MLPHRVSIFYQSWYFEMQDIVEVCMTSMVLAQALVLSHSNKRAGTSLEAGTGSIAEAHGGERITLTNCDDDGWAVTLFLLTTNECPARNAIDTIQRTCN
jgi:hypothetical protein